MDTTTNLLTIPEIPNVQEMLDTWKAFEHNMAEQRRRILAEFPDFDDLSRDYTPEEHQRMHDLSCSLHAEAGALDKKRRALQREAMTEILEAMDRQLPAQLRARSKAVLETLKTSEGQLVDLRIILWYLNRFQGPIPGFMDALDWIGTTERKWREEARREVAA